ncbi:GNAT family N-acetyltransferase [Paenibacillus nanensis]|uniref:GNAT family N-acetyltransferase n=1 Tax=Paenibacillus nanensis TaxID=393251 RepID=A0A3A1UYS7_9BACL|nr:GNAT family N-acetyltransferase [Paenibacillus nanensis]
MVNIFITLKQLSNQDEASLLDREFSRHYKWYRQGDYFFRCLEENTSGKRVSLMAFYEGALAGCCHLLYESNYPYFRDENIPEINDLNVFPAYRRKMIASKLFDELEKIASYTSSYIGLGVGLYQDYGNAQRMYGKRGFVMDGRGITYKNNKVQPGQSVTVDDDLLLYLIKELDRQVEL